MGNMTGGIIIVVAFALAFGVARAIMQVRAKRERQRAQVRSDFQRLQKSMQPPSKNKSKRRREQQLLQKKG